MRPLARLGRSFWQIVSEIKKGPVKALSAPSVAGWPQPAPAVRLATTRIRSWVILLRILSSQHPKGCAIHSWPKPEVKRSCQYRAKWQPSRLFYVRREGKSGSTPSFRDVRRCRCVSTSSALMVRRREAPSRTMRRCAHPERMAPPFAGDARKSALLRMRAFVRRPHRSGMRAHHHGRSATPRSPTVLHVRSVPVPAGSASHPKDRRGAARSARSRGRCRTRAPE
jgi:hypothetical protein